MSRTNLGRVMVCAAICGFTSFASPAFGQGRGEEQTARPAVELTPFAGIGSQGSSPVGVAIAFPWTDQLSIEAETGYRRGEGHLHALSSSVNLLFGGPKIGRVAPYLATGIGLQSYGAPVNAPGYGLFTQPRIGFTFNAGGGLKVPVTDRFGFRSDARWVKRFGRTGGEHWRVYNGMTVSAGKR